LMNRTVRYADQLRQIFQCAGDAVERVELRATLIDALSIRNGPSAICRFVIAIGVDAIQRMVRGWAQSHIREEILEGLQPSRTDANASATVLCEFLSRGIRTPLAQITPCFEFWRRGHAVRGRSRDELFHTQASARARACEVVGLHNRFFAAVAAAVPAWVFRVGLWITRPEHGQSADSLIRLNLWHLQSMPYFGLFVKESS